MNLTLSKRGDYVVRSAICLARAYGSDRPKKLREVSAEMEVPRTFVSQILGDLVRAGIAVSSFGKDGGYRLARPPAETTLLEVVEAAEGPLAPKRCALGDGPCRWDAVCPLHETWGAVTVSMREVLETTSLATLAERDVLIERGEYPVPSDAHRLVGSVVPVSDSVQIEAPVAVVVERLAGDGSWLVPFADAASLEASAKGRAGEREIGVVAVRLGEMVTRDEATVVPLLWEAPGPSGLFPRFQGDLTLHGLDPERSEVCLEGRYRPIAGSREAPSEAAARAARAALRSFLRAVAHALEEPPVVAHRSGASRRARGARGRAASPSRQSL